MNPEYLSTALGLAGLAAGTVVAQFAWRVLQELRARVISEQEQNRRLRAELEGHIDVCRAQARELREKNETLTEQRHNLTALRHDYDALHTEFQTRTRNGPYRSG